MSSTRTSTSSRLSVHRSPVSLTSLLVGIAFLLVGVMGFIPGITTDYGQLSWAGPDSHAHLLGVFQVSVLHNVLHLLFGVLGVVLARWSDAAKAYLLVGGAAYLGLWVYGLVVAQDAQANFVPLNTADDWLHLGLGAGMVLFGLLMPRRTSTGTAQTYAGGTAGGDVQ
ncbi:DUF4383 domain-containing protein [Kineococcus auxinigenes]|uniref:DUF4383 domain-containing protein n=1 Tax=unclassified Kineococcus TaxID=2621656 RepID=UPI003D7E901E